MAASGTLDQLNFEVLLKDDVFRKTIQKDIEIAKDFNLTMSEAMRLSTKMSAVPQKVNIETKQSRDALKELNDWYRQLEKDEWSRIGADINLEPYVAQAIAKLKELEKELNTINSLRAMEGGSGNFYYAEEFKRAKEAADGVLRSIEAMKTAQQGLGVEKTNSAFREFIENLTRADIGLLQLREHYAALEKSPQKAAQYYKEMQNAAKGVTQQLQATLPVGRTAEGMAAERAAIEKRIAENLAREQQELSKIKTHQGERAATSDKIRKTEQEITQRIKEGEEAQKRHNDALNRMHASLKRSSSVLRTISQLTGVYFGAIGLRRFLSSLIEITGQFEVQRMALRSMLQDIDGADKIFQDLYRFSSESTYRFSELSKYAKQLAAFNIDKNSLLETTKMLGDVASGVGVSMDKLILAYGHVKSSGFLRGIQLRSFSQNGVPILDELSKMLTEIEGKAVSLGDVFDKMTKREISFEMVEEAFKRMTSEGGKFYNMQEVLAKTLTGQINILKGRWENMLAAIGDTQSGMIKEIVGGISNSLIHYENFGKKLAEIIALYGAYKVALMLAAGAAAGLTTAETIQIGVMELLNKTILANPYTLLALALISVGAATYKLIDGLETMTGVQKTLRNEQTKYSTDLATSVNELDLLYGKLKLAAEGTEEYNGAVREIQSRYGEYLSQLKAEGIEVGNLASVYDNLRKKIENAARARFIDSATAAIDQQYGEDFGKIMNGGRYSVDNVTKQLDLNAKEEGFLKLWVGGLYSEEDLKDIDEAASLLEKLNGAYISLGGGDSGPMKASQYIDELSGRVRNLNKDYNDAKRVITEFGMALVNSSGENGGDGNDITYKIGAIVDGIKKLDKEIDNYRKKAQSPNGITEDEKSALEKLVEDRDEQAKLYKDLMGVDYDKSTTTKTKEVENATKERISGIKSQITILEKYKSAYDKLEPYFGDETEEQMSKIFGNQDYSKLDSQIEELVSDLRTLGDEGIEAADQIEARLGTDAVSKLISAQKDIEKQQKALEKWQKTLRKWEKDWGNTYSGMDREVYDVLASYNDEMKQIEDEYTDAQKEIQEAHKGNEEAIKNETDALDNLRLARENATKANAQDKLSKLAEKVIKESRDKLNMNDWGDKSFNQVRNIYNNIKELLKDEAFGVDADIIKQVEAGGLSLQKFFELVKKGYEEMGEETNQENVKKIIKLSKFAAQQIASLSKELIELGEASGNDTLTAVGETIDGIASTVSSIAQGWQAGGVWGAIIAGAVEVGKSLLSAAAEAEELQNAINGAREEARLLRIENEVANGVNTIFGKNQTQEILNSAKAMEELKNHTAELLKTMAGFNEDNHWWFDMHEASEWAKVNALDKGYSDLESFAIRTKKYNGFTTFLRHLTGGNGSKFTNLKDAIEGLGYTMYDEDGFLNPDALNAVLETYSDMTSAEKDFITQAMDDAKKYKELVQQVDSSIESLFGDIASNVADNLVDSWIDAGNAALDYADILDDVARSYAKMLVKDMIIGTAFDENTQKALRNAFMNGRADDAMAIVASAMERAQNVLPMAEQLLQSLDPYFVRDEDQSNSLGSGIKSITEDTAGLLASYINAIRADVSVMRGLQQSGWQNVSAILGFLQSPTLNDHIARTEANTYDIAQSNSRILAELQSVIRSGSNGGMVVMAEIG